MRTALVGPEAGVEATGRALSTSAGDVHAVFHVVNGDSLARAQSSRIRAGGLQAMVQLVQM
jgi:hypothetical protein